MWYRTRKEARAAHSVSGHKKLEMVVKCTYWVMDWTTYEATLHEGYTIVLKPQPVRYY